MYDFAIIGGGIVGLATALAIGKRYPIAKIVVIEKETTVASHQTGNNSGVIHSGIYYKPGSFKAKFCRDGSRSMVEFCSQHNIAHEVCGKVIVATHAEELPRLEHLYQRGRENGLELEKLTSEQVREIEPHVQCSAGIRVFSTGIVNYRQVAEKYVELVTHQGGEVQLGTKVTKLETRTDATIVTTNKGTISTRYLINCAGLFSDRIARLGKTDPQARIVPFRGEYYELVSEKRYLVKHLIYPVPNPSFPFLGVHFTRMIDGSVHAGPNAVLSLKREGYHKSDFNLRDLTEVMTYPGFWKLAAKHADEGIKEMIRSVSKAAFVKSLQQLIPEVTADDVVPTHAGVRAQALQSDGKLVDDFLIVPGMRAMHVCNAPSPAATSSLEIGKAISLAIPAQSHLESTLIHV